MNSDEEIGIPTIAFLVKDSTDLPKSKNFFLWQKLKNLPGIPWIKRCLIKTFQCMLNWFS